MNKLKEVLAEQPLEVQFKMQRLALEAHDPKSDPISRLKAAMELGDIGGPMIIESLRREVEPRYEYRFVRGARTKVRVN